MLFSVVIPAFNRIAFLPDTLASLGRQTFTDYEAIVVDDGSTDGTAEYAAKMPGVTVIRQQNRGPGAARNAGVAAARGEYIAFLDSDDIWFPWTLETFAAVIAGSAPSILTARYVDFSADSELAGIHHEPHAARRFSDFFASAAHDISAGSNTLVIKRTVLLASGGFTDQPINLEDHDLVLRLGDAPGFAQVLAPVTLGWRRHPRSLTADLDRSIAGIAYLIRQESGGAYPGTLRRSAERRAIITRHLRPITIAALRAGRVAAALRLYRAALSWHAAAGRWAYLLGFPLLAARAALGRPVTR